MFRQGEVLLQPVKSLPKGEISTKKDYVVSHSETGHHHVLEGEVEVVETQDETFLNLRKAMQLVHKKSADGHDTLTVKPGKYLVRHKSEYDPFREVVRRVQD